jgi:uncharacterized protein
MSTPRWLADEMVGRLARYVRFVGGDVVYVRGASDDEILERARVEGRVILTRDRALAARADRALLLTSSAIRDQWREVRGAWPEIGSEVRFLRCSECNGELSPYRRGTDPRREVGLPSEQRAPGLALFACAACGHLYWEGSHTASIRARLRAWSDEGPP